MLIARITLTDTAPVMVYICNDDVEVSNSSVRHQH